MAVGLKDVLADSDQTLCQLGADGWVCSLLFLFFPLQLQSTELLATTEEQSSRGGSSQGHKAGPLVVVFM